ncbi:MAG: Spy/CpxP family protein refolding chaperone [Nitrospirota bacterium]
MKRLIISIAIFIAGMFFVVPLNYAHMDKSYSDEGYDEMHERMREKHGREGTHFREHKKGHKRHEMRPGGRHRSPLYFKEDLGLSEKQIKELKGLKIQKKEMKREMIKRRAEITIAETDLSDILERDKIDMSDIEKKVKEINDLHGKMRLSHIKLIIKEKQILTKEQYEKYRELSEIEFMRGISDPWSIPPWRQWEWH